MSAACGNSRLAPNSTPQSRKLSPDTSTHPGLSPSFSLFHQSPLRVSQHTQLAASHPHTYLQPFRNFHGQRFMLIISTAQLTSTVHTASSNFKILSSFPVFEIRGQKHAETSKYNTCSKITTCRAYYIEINNCIIHFLSMYIFYN